ncbi:MAG TPA: flagellar basal-body rod protein FlgF [Candidatus Cybelea sp.]|nr:flagellar basal-body rod protein FlgF [Candidatus Cybelea sp.]
MENAVYVGLSQQTAMRRELDIVANNLANMNTSAFKAEHMLFHEFLVKAGAKEPVSFVEDYGVVRDMSEGRLESTNNPYDVAITGPGFLAVDTKAGTRYTRNGHLRLGPDGQLVTESGLPVLDDRLRPITLNARDGQPTIADDGTISNASGTVAKLDMVQFENNQALTKQGNGLFSTDQTPLPADKSHLQQGMVEGSNVEPIREMTRMMDVLRTYETTQNMVQTDSNRQKMAIERLAKFS